MQSLGESLIGWLEAYGVDTVFGIPGVHNVELYRGLSDSGIHHVTPRHEQGAGFMADGYARVTGRPGVAFVITGPGLTNILTPMAQAYADSIPMLVISSTNRTDVGGMGGDLHEIRNPGLIAAQAAAFSHTITDPAQLPQVLARAWAVFEAGRPRPVHIQVPVDLLSAATVPAPARLPVATRPGRPPAREDLASLAGHFMSDAQNPLIIAGGGAMPAALEIGALAAAVDAPVVMTTNGRGILQPDDRLGVPCSPSLEAVRELIAGSDFVLAVGTEMGRTDYDMYDRADVAIPGRLIRVDIDPEQLNRGATPFLPIVGDAAATVSVIGERLRAPVPVSAEEVRAAEAGGTGDRSGQRRADTPGEARARATREAALKEIGDSYRRSVAFLNAIRETLPAAPIVGNSTQAIYAGNLYFAADIGRWFNAATGYGALGYGLPAAIGAARGERLKSQADPLHADDPRPVVCIAGDGGLQFSMADLGTAVEERLPVILLVWNNRGYGEIKQFMLDRQITPVGVDLHTPDFVAIGEAYGAKAVRLARADDLPDRLRAAASRKGPTLIEIDEALVLGEEMG